MSEGDGLRKLARALRQTAEDGTRELAEQMQTAGERVADAMKAHLMENGNIDTGALYDSCRSETEAGSGIVVTRIYADAKSEDGTPYAEFIEYGTGIYNEKGTGRTTPWRYRDRHGSWHWTRGNHGPYPFIRPAYAEHAAEFPQAAQTAFRIEKYHKGGAGV